MKNYTVRKYLSQDYSNWNAFIDKAKNATFLFHRDFMEYHSDRFQDFSLIVLDGDKWIAVLPANISDNEVISHQGLTYGGMVYDNSLKLSNTIEIFKNILAFLNENKIEKLHLKTMPPIYCDFPSDEIQYALFLTDARLSRRDCLAVIDNQKKNKIASGRMEGIKKGTSLGLKVMEETNFSSFWNVILIPNLEKKYAVQPVHTLDEIEYLHSKFSRNIRQFNVYHNGEIVAGTTIFETKNVAHSQYISANEDKNELGSLDFLYHYLITEVFKNKPFFDFGISNENQGRNLNKGLSFWKESFGARTITQDFYEVETSNFSKLENILI